MSALTYSCPFCGFITPDTYELALHVEELHVLDSPFIVKKDGVRELAIAHDSQARDRCHDDASLALAMQLEAAEQDRNADMLANNRASQDLLLALTLGEQKPHLPADRATSETDGDFPYVECSERDCSEFVHLADLNDHIDLHAASRHSLEADNPQTIASQYTSNRKTDHRQSLQLPQTKTSAVGQPSMVYGKQYPPSSSPALHGGIMQSENATSPGQTARSVYKMGHKRRPLGVMYGQSFPSNLIDLFDREQSSDRSTEKSACQIGCTGSYSEVHQYARPGRSGWTENYIQR